ncbi:hypothetical protein [Paenibacillus senegalimassiliensis]|uniref:hypothetical protein n=1 Tax=Paenibacillus senegalimassiliensis TaxID=1737426 RepID=UPI00073F085E|nr:hypothetical protein [Paenibacillus senegalimassiliensis]
MLNPWKDIWAIVERELRHDRFYVIANVIFMIYLGVIMGTIIDSAQGTQFKWAPLGNYLMLTVVPMTGLFFSRRNFNYIKEDSYTQMLRYYRTLAIPLNTIMWGRLTQLAVAMFINNLFLYTACYGFIRMMGDSLLAADTMVAFALTWLGCGLLINGMFIYYEFLTSGKVYFWVTLLIMLVLALVVVILNVWRINLLEITLDFSLRYGLLSPLLWGTLLVGGIGLSLLSMITRRKMGMRDLA